jgi:MFS family permease
MYRFNSRVFALRVLIVAVTLFVVATIGASIALAAAPAGPGLQGTEPPAPPQIPSLVEFLQMLASGIIVGPAIAFLFERFEWFQKLSGSARFWVILALSVGLPVLGTALLQLVPADIWAQLQPYWAALATGITIWIGTQVAHRFQRLPTG